MLVAFSGLKGSGKDTAAKVLVDEYGFTKIAFADAVRELALIIDPYVSVRTNYGIDIVRLSHLIETSGWDYTKRNVAEVRRLMQVIGTEGGRMLMGENVWVDILAKRYPDIAEYHSRYVITDCRFDNEVDFVRNNGGLVVWIDRPGVVSDGHASESTHIKGLATIIIHNDSEILELQADVRFMLFVRGFDPIE